MSGEVKYEVVREFKYAGKMLQPGDEFIPGKGKYDELLLDSKYLRRVETFDANAKKQTRGRKAKVKDGSS